MDRGCPTSRAHDYGRASQGSSCAGAALPFCDAPSDPLGRQAGSQADEHDPEDAVLQAPDPGTP